FSKMSWMDSWSRPSKSQPVPPPLYLTTGTTVPYCYTCGRIISPRRTKSSQEVKYCSTRCRHSKPGPIDRKIETVFAALLDGASLESLTDGASDGEAAGKKEEGHAMGGVGGAGAGGGGGGKGKKKKTAKGDPRVIVDCVTVEAIMFPRAQEPLKVFGRRKNRAPRGVVEKPEDWCSVDMVDDPPPPPASTSKPPAAGSVHSASTHEADTRASEKGTTDDDREDEEQDEGGVALETPRAGGLPDEIPYGYGGGKIRPPQAQNDINGGVGGEKGWAERIEETDEMKAKRREGQKRADEREMVRRAARRGVAFGFVSGEDAGEKRKCEAVMKGMVVEASFAKGEWGIRWREKI
ncbi:hypothetical protein K458DRAFT_238784, partial [Lentithecium fluviatile CBS 122367]